MKEIVVTFQMGGRRVTTFAQFLSARTETRVLQNQVNLWTETGHLTVPGSFTISRVISFQ